VREIVCLTVVPAGPATEENPPSGLKQEITLALLVEENLSSELWVRNPVLLGRLYIELNPLAGWRGMVAPPLRYGCLNLFSE
jgi:hypothetical protein